MSSIKLFIGKHLYNFGTALKKVFYRKRHLQGDTLLISPKAWTLFTPPHLQNTDNELHIVFADISEVKREDMSMIIGYIGNLSDKEISQLSDRFAWLQIPSHGFNGYDRKDLYKNPNIMVSCVKDVFSRPIAQFCLTAYYAFNTIAFRPSGVSLNDCQLISNRSSLMIYGLGNIGHKIAEVFKNAGWGTVIGVKRNIVNQVDDYVDRLCTFDESLELLCDVDYVVNILPESKDTIGIFNKRFFEKMKPDALFCNVGRKSTVIDSDIAEAVKQRQIRGAILDAHNDYRYGTPNIILTGHKSSLSADNAKAFDSYFKSQLDLFLSGKSVANRIL